MTYTLSLLIRWARVFFHGIHKADVELLPARTMLVTVPTTLTWSPGQHFFFRFLTGDIHAFTSHPFTVASIPRPQDDKHATSSIQILAKVEGGMTARLALAVGGKAKSVRVMIDGPYGGVGAELGAYDHALLIGGGTGKCG